MNKPHKKPLISEAIKEFLLSREFVYIATSTLNGLPNVAPKFVLSIEGETIFLADYVKNITFLNLKSNHQVSLSALDRESLIGYQLNGTGQILARGELFERMKAVFQSRQVELSTQRIIAGVRAEKSHASFEVVFPAEIAIFRIRVREVVYIHPNGTLERVS